MFLAGCNFVLHFHALRGRFQHAARNAEFRVYVLVLLAATALLTAFLLFAPASTFAAGERPAAYGDVSRTVRDATFQAVSIVTTTGYGTADFENWPTLCLVVLLYLMVLGAMAGSTAGGVKTVRVVLSFSVLRNAFARGLHPRSVGSIKYDGQTVPASTLAGIWAFLTAYVLILVGATAIMSTAGYDLVGAASAAITATGNVGPALGPLGPTEVFDGVPAYGKITLAMCMIAGRLEIYTLFMLFVPGFWRR
jgi:trk system potassium uptake protein TrkH